jgi:hypothetical protein
VCCLKSEPLSIQNTQQEEEEEVLEIVIVIVWFLFFSSLLFEFLVLVTFEN